MTTTIPRGGGSGDEAPGEGFSLFPSFSSLGLWVWWCFVESGFLVWRCFVRYLREIKPWRLELHGTQVHHSRFTTTKWVPCTQDVTWLNCFGNVLTNEIVWDSVLFKKKKKILLKSISNRCPISIFWREKPTSHTLTDSLKIKLLQIFFEVATLLI